jgi:predicted nucleotidyltransferase
MKFHDSFLQLIDTEPKRKIVWFLLKNESAMPGRQAGMSEREISSLVGISHMTVNRVLRDLEQWNFVSYERVGRAHVWKINQQSYIHDALSFIRNAFESAQSPFEKLKKDILEYLPKKYLIKVVLFGSIAKNEEAADSDIDIFILVKNKEAAQPLEESIEKLSIHCLEKFGNRLSPYVLTEREFQQRKDLKLLDEINQGIQLFPEGKEEK